MQTFGRLRQEDIGEVVAILGHTQRLSRDKTTKHKIKSKAKKKKSFKLELFSMDK